MIQKERVAKIAREAKAIDLANEKRRAGTPKTKKELNVASTFAVSLGYSPSRLDFFVAAALTGLLANPVRVKTVEGGTSETANAVIFAKAAIARIEEGFPTSVTGISK